MTIRELRDYLNGLDESVMDFNVYSTEVYRAEVERTMNIELSFGGDEMSLDEIKKDKGLYLTLDDFYLGKYDELCIIPDTMEVVKIEEEL